MAFCFKKQLPFYQLAYLHFNPHPIKNQIHFIYFSRNEFDDSRIFIDSKNVEKDFVRTFKHTFFDRVFIYEHTVYFRPPQNSKELEVSINDIKTYIHYYEGKNKKQFFKKFKLEKLFKKDAK